MRLLLLLGLVFLGAAALAIWLLPWWLSAALIIIIGVPLCWIIWKIRGFLKQVKKRLEGILPQEKLCSLAAGEPFQGKGFAFTFPVACEVSQTHVADKFEALILKPKFDFAGVPKDTLLVVSSFPRDEIKDKLSAKLDTICAQVKPLQLENFAPVQVGPLQGERRGFHASHDGKELRGESVFLGDKDCSIAWFAFGPVEIFESVAAKYRELACLVQRLPAATAQAGDAGSSK